MVNRLLLVALVASLLTMAGLMAILPAALFFGDAGAVAAMLAACGFGIAAVFLAIAAVIAYGWRQDNGRPS